MADKHTTREYIARQFKNFKTYIDKIYLPTNKKTLDGFSESSEGGLLWNNEPIEGGANDAIDVNYDNSASGLDSENVQDAIDELDETIDDNKINYELDESGTGLTISGPGFGGSSDGSGGVPQNVLCCGKMTYIGNGKSGKSNPIILTFPVKPIIVYVNSVYAAGGPGFCDATMVQGKNYAKYNGVEGETSSYTRRLNLAWSDDGKTLSWDAGSQSAASMLNANDAEYTVYYFY